MYHYYLQITGEGSDDSKGLVRSVSESTGLATVELLPPSSDDFTPPRYSDTVQVPITRLRPPNQDVSDQKYFFKFKMPFWGNFPNLVVENLVHEFQL